ncbi:hypothetical protein ACFQ0B_66630 [Nonomuraea thailandensis]
MRIDNGGAWAAVAVVGYVQVEDEGAEAGGAAYWRLRWLRTP